MSRLSPVCARSPFGPPWRARARRMTLQTVTVWSCASVDPAFSPMGRDRSGNTTRLFLWTQLWSSDMSRLSPVCACAPWLFRPRLSGVGAAVDLVSGSGPRCGRIKRVRDDADEDIVSDGHSGASNWTSGLPWASILDPRWLEWRIRTGRPSSASLTSSGYIHSVFLSGAQSPETSLFGLPYFLLDVVLVSPQEILIPIDVDRLH